MIYIHSIFNYLTNYIIFLTNYILILLYLIYYSFLKIIKLSHIIIIINTNIPTNPLYIKLYPQAIVTIES
jgi:hypothetical protein